jgi:hypothetical protein
MSTDAEQLLALAADAHKQFETAVKSGQILRNCLNGQADIIAQINKSIPPVDAVVKEIESLESQLASVNEHLQKANLFLAQLLMRGSADPGPRSAGPVLQAVLQTTQDSIVQASKDAIAGGRGTVSLTEIINIEDQIDQLIHEMEDREMYPESDDEREDRNRAMETHNKKVVAFLSHIQKLLNDQIPG